MDVTLTLSTLSLRYDWKLDDSAFSSSITALRLILMFHRYLLPAIVMKIGVSAQNHFFRRNRENLSLNGLGWDHLEILIVLHLFSSFFSSSPT